VERGGTEMLVGLEAMPNDVKNIVIFGCTEYGLILCDKFQKWNDIQEVIFFDNNPNLKMFQGYRVERPHKNSDENIIYIISSVAHADIMKKQLLEFGIAEEKILFTANILESKYKNLQTKRVPRQALRFVMDLAEHCNLNCQSCDHFSPLAKEKFTDIEEFERDIRRLSEICSEDKTISNIDLEGGEPLLNPNAEKYVEIIHKYLPKTQVSIYTNGIKLPDMSEEFWRICSTHNVILEITKYPITFDYGRVEQLAKEKNVVCRYYSGGKVVKTLSHKPLDMSGKQDKYDSFHKCYMANSGCTMLKHGRIYPCTVSPNICVFNEYFDKDLKISDKDSISIYEADSIGEILDFLTNPIPACRYCQPDAWTHGHIWQTSRRDIKEWA